MSVFVTILIGLAGGALPATIITGVFTFRLNRATAVKVVAEAHEVSKRTALAEAEAALEFSDRRFEQFMKDYGRLETDCTKCHTRVDEMRTSLESVLQAIDAIMARVHPTNGHDVTVTVTQVEADTVRVSMREARKHLN